MTDSIMKWFFSVFIIGGYIWLSFIVISGQINAGDPQKLLLIGSAYGSLATMAGSVVAYHFGSSKTSSDKDKTISSMAANIPVQGSTQTVTATTKVEPIPPAEKPQT